MQFGSRTRVYSLVLCALAATLRAQDAAHSTGWIVIPAHDYETLRAHAQPAPLAPEPSPHVDATLTRVEYDLRIEGELATGHATLTVDVLHDGWVRVPIPPGLLVRDALLEGKPVSLLDCDLGRPAALLQKRGRSLLNLEVALPVTSVSGNEKLVLPAGPSGVTRASIALTRADLDIKVTGGFLAERAESAGESKWLAFGAGGEPLTFTWRRKIEDHKIELPLRMRGSLTQLLGLGEDSTSVYAEVNLEILQGAAREVRIQLPGTIAVNQVLGANVGDWEAQQGGLLVRFLEPVEKSARFVLTGDTRLPREGRIDVPLLALLDVERESGGVGVEVLGAGEVKDLQSHGLESTAASELGAAIAARQSPSLVAFKFRLGDTTAARSLTLNVARYQQEAVLTANVEEARYRVLLTREGKELIEARFAVRNNQRNFVKIALPAGAVVWNASLAGRAVHPGQAPDGGLLFPLDKSRAGEDAPPFPVEILYEAPAVRWEERARATLSLPALDLPISRTGVELYYPPAYKVAVEPGSFRVETYRAPVSPALNGVNTIPRVDTASDNTQVAQSGLLQGLDSNAAQAATQALIDRYRARVDARKPPAGASDVAFPAVGPSLFLISELTGENQAPHVEMNYQRESKGGVK